MRRYSDEMLKTLEEIKDIATQMGALSDPTVMQEFDDLESAVYDLSQIEKSVSKYN